MIVREIKRKRDQRRKRVAAYCRVSTNLDSQEESLETQISNYTRQIQGNAEWDFAGIYADEGLSGTKTENRVQFTQMIQDAVDGKIDLILCKSVSRFSRNVVECQRYLKFLSGNGVHVRFERDNIDTSEPSSNMRLTFLSAIAQSESESISENIKWANRQRVRRGVYNLGNNRILGYDTDNTGKLVPNQQAWIVREVYRRFLEKENFRQIADGLTQMGARPLHSRGIGSKSGFRPETLRYMLKNETYVGDKRLQKQPPINFLTKRPETGKEYESNYLANDHAAIIDRKTWEAVQERLKEQEKEIASGIYRKGKKHHFLYGKAFCGVCGAPYTRKTYQSGGVNYKAWNCRERQRGEKGNGCRNKIVREEELMKRIGKEMGWEWEGKVQEEKFCEVVERVEIFESRVVVRRKEELK